MQSPTDGAPMVTDHVATGHLSLKAMAARVQASALRLRYAFPTDPNPIRASAGGADPNVVSLQVLISNPGTTAVSVTKITIEIPVGENIARDLSAASDLPAPVYDASGEWIIRSAGSVITIEPVDGSTGEVTDTIIFTLEKIAVGQMPGTVPITITEYPVAKPKVIDAGTYVLVKLPSDFPVTAFYAEHDVLDTPDVPARLHWRCSDEGKNLYYSISSSDWQPKNCLDGGECFSCEDGQTGVDTPPINASTTFELDVITADAGGNRVIRARLLLTVRLVVPEIRSYSHVEAIIANRFVMMRWVAVNAVRCQVLLDGNVIDDAAPVDTFRRGYPLMLPDVPGRHQLAVVAFGESGVQVPYAFPDINIRERVTLTVAGETRALALTPDGHRAVMTHIAGSHPYVSIIDLTTRTFEAQNIPTNGGTPNGIAITPNGALALVTGFSMFGTSTQVNFVDLRAHVTEPASVPIPSAISVAVTHDGARALVGELAAFKASLIDIARRALDAQIDLQQMGTIALAITPDDRLAITVSAFGTVRFIDLTTRTAEPGTLKVGKRPGAIAVTPDGRLALVADVDLGLITVIDVATRSAEPRTIAIPPVFDMAAQSIAITGNGRYALVAGRAGVLTIVDIARRTALPDVIRAIPSSGIAISRDGRTIVLIGHWSSVVTVM